MLPHCSLVNHAQPTNQGLRCLVLFGAQASDAIQPKRFKRKAEDSPRRFRSVAVVPVFLSQPEAHFRLSVRFGNIVQIDNAENLPVVFPLKNPRCSAAVVKPVNQIVDKAEGLGRGCVRIPHLIAAHVFVFHAKVKIVGIGQIRTTQKQTPGFQLRKRMKLTQDWLFGHPVSLTFRSFETVSFYHILRRL